VRLVAIELLLRHRIESPFTQTGTAADQSARRDETNDALSGSATRGTG
jgi:hypothetical protein